MRRSALGGAAAIVAIGIAVAALYRTDEPGVAASAGSVAPYALEDCELLGKNYGSYRPSLEEAVDAAAKVATGICYGYWEHDPRRLAASVRHCAAQAGGNTVSFEIPRAEGGCRFALRAVSFKQRRWIWMESFYARNGQFGNRVDILEVTRSGFEPYASGWQCPMTWEGAVANEPLPASSAGISRTMSAEWQTLPSSLRAFLCTAELVGDDLSAPQPDE